MTHVNLMIVTPGRSMLRGYVECLLATAAYLAEKNITFGWSSKYSSNVYDSREISLSGTYENDISHSLPFGGEITYDKILWIDSDILWSPEDAYKLYISDKDVISGVYFQANGEIMAFTELFGAPLTMANIKGKTEPFEIYAAGFGFVCFKQGVFESLSRPWFQMVSGTKVMNGVEVTLPIMGEDLSLFHRVKQLNYSIWLDPSVMAGHVKSVICTQNGMIPA